MRNAQIKPGYNLQMDVEGEYIVGAMTSSERSDQLTLIPFLDELSEKLPRKFKNNISKRESMAYDQVADEYICHNNKRLKYVSDISRKLKSGYQAKVKVYECESCEGCKYKELCTKAQGNRKLYVSPVFVEKRKKSLENIQSPQGITLRMNRSIQVEGAFGVLKEDYGFRKFLTRGKRNVLTEFMLLCFGYNINKLHKNIQKEKLGVTLYKKDLVA